LLSQSLLTVEENADCCQMTSPFFKVSAPFAIIIPHVFAIVLLFYRMSKKRVSRRLGLGEIKIRSSTRKKGVGPLDKIGATRYRDLLDTENEEKETVLHEYYGTKSYQWYTDNSQPEQPGKDPAQLPYLSRTDDASEGVFVITPSTTSQEMELRDECGGFMPLFDGKEPQEFVRRRYVAYTKYVSYLECTVQNVLGKVYQKVISEIVNFIDNAYKIRHLQLNNIPTALVIAGISLADHKRIFSLIMNALRQKKVRVVTLNAMECTSLRDAMDTVITSVLPHSFKFSEGELTFRLLVDCYQQMDSHDSEDKPKIVVFVEDFEYFNAAVIQDLIAICSEYTHILKIVLIIGLATSTEAIHRLLPWSISMKLDSQKFFLLSPSQLLDVLIENLLIKGPPMKLGPLPLQHFLIHFDALNTSIDFFVQSLKFAALEHYFNNPFSFLCVDDVMECEKLLSDLNEKHYERVSWWLFKHSTLHLSQADTQTLRSFFQHQQIICLSVAFFIIFFQEICTRLLSILSFCMTLSAITSRYKVDISPESVLRVDETFKDCFKCWIKDAFYSLSNFSTAFKCWFGLQTVLTYESPSLRKEYLAAISRNLQTRFQICTKEICRLSNESINWLLGYCLKQAEKNKKMGQESEILKRFLQRLQTFCSMSHSLPVTNITHKVEVSSHNFDDAKEKDKNSPNLKDSTVNEKHPFKETQTQSSTASEHTLASVSSPSLHLQSSGERPAKRKANHSQYLRKRKELISPLESKISNKEKRQRAVESFQQFTTEVAEFLLSFLQKYLRPMYETPMWEVFFCNKKNLPKCLNPSICTDLKYALQNSREILECDCCKNTDTSYAMEDLCIAFNYYRQFRDFKKRAAKFAMSSLTQTTRRRRTMEMLMARRRAYRKQNSLHQRNEQCEMSSCRDLFGF